MRSFRQITNRDRVKISRLKALGFSNSEISRKTGFHRSSISREFSRNAEPEEIDYDSWVKLTKTYPEEEIEPPPSARDRWVADFASRNRNLRLWRANQIRRRKESKLMKWVITKLQSGWTPEQIAGRSKIDGPGSISYECIYNYIAADRKAGGKLFYFLKRFRKRKRRLSVRSYAGQLPNRTFIDKRPYIVEKRLRLGDLEADLICGQRAQGYLLTVVDRVSRKVVIKKLKTKSKEETFFILCRAMDEFKVLRTLTVDNGKEFALHQKLSKEKRIKIFFTHPYTSQEKGTVENTNGLIRQKLRGMKNFRKISDKRIKKIEMDLNHCPRKVLNYLTPIEVENRNK